MIRSFGDRETKLLFETGRSRRFAAIVPSATRKLTLINGARELRDLRSLPGNRLEALKGDRQGQYSIRINDQFRICFIWTASGPEEVRIVDYH